MNTKSASLYIGLGIPVLMVLIIAGIAFVPGWFAPKPQTSFVYGYYENGSYYSPYQPQYQVKNGRLEAVAPVSPPTSSYEKLNVPPRLFVYDPSRNESREINLSEAQTFKLNDNRESPDGYTMTYANRNGGGLFEVFMYDYDSRNNVNNVKYYLSGHATKIRINLYQSTAGTRDYWNQNVRFIGWITQ